MDGSTVRLLDALAKDAGVRYEYDNWGNSRLVVPQDAAEKFFAAFSEENVQKLTHPAEYKARTVGDDSLKVAKDYTPVAYVKVPDPDGNIARWLDKAENIYIRTSTHARSYLRA